MSEEVRRHIVTIEIQADTWDAVAGAISTIARDLQVKQPPIYTGSMGDGAEYNYLIRENKERDDD